MGFIHKVSKMIPYVGPAPNRKQYREIEWWGKKSYMDRKKNAIGRRIMIVW